MIVRESISFERGKDPKDSIRIGRKAQYKGWTAYDVAEEIYDRMEDDKILIELTQKGHDIITDQGYEGWDDYRDEIYTGADEIPEVIEINKKISKRIQNILEVEFPIDAMYDAEDTIWSFLLFGGSKESFLYNISRSVDNEYLNESVSFERGADPKEKMRIGDEELRIYNKMASIANYLGIDEYNTDDLNQQKVIATWKMPGIIGELDTTGYGRIILYKNDIGGSTEYQMYARGVRGSDIQPWTKWDTAEKWEENLRYLLNESVNFERGKDPRHAMEVGAIVDTPEIKGMDIEMGPDGMIKSHEDYIKAQENTWGENVDDEDFITDVLENWEEEAIYAYSFWVNDPTEEDEDWEYWHAPEMEGETLLWKDKLYNIPKTGKFKTIADGVSESVNFERGKDPIDTMNIGAKELLKSDSLGLRPGWTFREKERPSALLGKDPMDVYILGFAGEIDYDEWYHNEFTEMLSDACIKGKVLKSKTYLNDNIYVLIDTKFGKIVRAQLDTEGLYFYGGLDAALNIGIQDIPQPERESMA